MDKEKLTNLITDFYHQVSQKSGKELDIDALVDYALENGLESLNSMLFSTYGEKINPSKNVHVFSPADAVKKRRKRKKKRRRDRKAPEYSYFTLREKIVRFYEVNDPKQLKVLDAIVQWVDNHGVRRLNKKLRKKYNRDLSSVEPYVFGGASRNDTVLSSKYEGVPEEELTAYFKIIDTTKLDVIHAIHLWSKEIGRDKFNETLNRRYGKDLGDFLDSIIKVSSQNSKVFINPKKSFTQSPKEDNLVSDSTLVAEPGYRGKSKLRNVGLPLGNLRIPTINPRLNPYNKKFPQKPKPPQKPAFISSALNANKASPVEESWSEFSPANPRKNRRKKRSDVSDLYSDAEADSGAPPAKPKYINVNKSKAPFGYNGKKKDGIPQTKTKYQMRRTVVNPRKTPCSNFQLNLFGKSYGECLNCGMQRNLHKKNNAKMYLVYK
eukprot:snap_masked-scaffold_18-processed-gene-6.48-mRNA-1 protein AED:1.00 eAED:1.00 QI:0/-1/0/0/-1/1/1/0/435